MKNELSFLILLFCIQVINGAGGPNEPPGSEFFTENSFDSKPGGPGYQGPGAWWDAYPTGNAQIVQDSDAPKSPLKVLQQTRPPNSTGGTVMIYTFPRPVREVYAAFWWKPSDPFYGWSNNTQKIATIQPVMNMFFMWFGPREQTRTGGVLLQTTRVDNSHLGCPYAFSSCNLYSNLSSGSITGGKWHLIEWYVKLSDTETSKNGIVRWWIDSTLAGNYTQVNLDNTEGLYSNFQFNHTWDSGDPNQTTTDYHWFDHAYVSAPNGAPEPYYISGNPSSASVGRSYSSTLSVNGGKAPFSWSIVSGSLQDGLNFNSGVISGKPLCGGRSNFTVKVTDGDGLQAVKSFSIVASGSPICASPINEKAVSDQQSAFGRNRIAVKTIGEKVWLSLPNKGSYLLSVYDLAGKKVYEHRANASAQKEIEIKTGLKNGIYFAKVNQGREMHAVRMSVMK